MICRQGYGNRTINSGSVTSTLIQALDAATWASPQEVAYRVAGVSACGQVGTYSPVLTLTTRVPHRIYTERAAFEMSLPIRESQPLQFFRVRQFP
jgi:hypothetical protein